EGLLFQGRVGTYLLDHMYVNCPESLEVVRLRTDDQLRTTIEDFMRGKEAEQDSSKIFDEPPPAEDTY
ncbi:MAG: hypothetical protein JSU74_03275, partial [Candidatus Zixiibacteriota bacterium]